MLAWRTSRRFGCYRFPPVRPADWENCLAMMEPGLPMDSEYSLPMATIYTSPQPMERTQKNLPPYWASPIGRDGPQTVHVCVHQWLTRGLGHLRFGKSNPTAVILILCCLAGVIQPRNVAAIGHRMGSISSL